MSGFERVERSHWTGQHAWHWAAQGEWWLTWAAKKRRRHVCSGACACTMATTRGENRNCGCPASRDGVLLAYSASADGSEARGQLLLSSDHGHNKCCVTRQVCSCCSSGYE